MMRRFPCLPLAALLWALLLAHSLSAGKAVNGTLRTGSELDYPPLAMVTPEGEADGFSVDLLRAAAARMGYEPHFTVAPWIELREQLEAGELDVLPLVGYSEERAEKMLFSKPYLIFHGSVFVRKGEEKRFNTLDDLQGKQIIVMQGDIAEDFLRTQSLEEQLILTRSLSEAMTMLHSGYGDCVLAISLAGTKVIEDLNLEDGIVRGINSIDTMITQWCFAVPKDKQHLIEHLDEALMLLRADGTYDALYSKWLLPYMHPQKDNFMQWVWIITILFLLLVAVIWFGTIVWTRSLRRLVKVRTEQLQHARDDAERASRAKSEFLAIMSHELRTPLNPIISISQLMLETEQDRGKRDCLEMILNSGKNLLGLISDILDLSRIESGKLELNTQRVKLQEFIQSLKSTFKTAAQQKGLQLNINIPYPLPEELIFDPLRVRQVIYNLLTNAIRYTERGSVTVQIKYRDDAHNETESATRGILEWRVIDTGIGIPEDRLRSIFDPFNQSATTHRSRSEGLGLGLAICHRLSTRMGGSLRVDSKPDSGSTFSFRLPVLTTQAEPEAIPVAIEPVQSQDDTKTKILLVEDDAMSRESLRLLLEKLGFKVDTAPGGERVISLVERERYDMVFMDVRLPEMNGIELTRRIRKSGNFQPYIIAQTAHAMREDRERCIDAGMDDYLSKPILMDDLRGAINRAQKRKR